MKFCWDFDVLIQNLLGVQFTAKCYTSPIYCFVLLFFFLLFLIKLMSVNCWGCIKQQAGSILLAFCANSRPVHLIVLSSAGMIPTPRLNLISAKHLVEETQSPLQHQLQRERRNRPSPADFLVDLPSKRMASKRAVTAGRAFGLAPAPCRWEASAGQQRDCRTQTSCATDDRCERYSKKMLLSHHTDIIGL